MPGYKGEKGEYGLREGVQEVVEEGLQENVGEEGLVTEVVEEGSVKERASSSAEPDELLPCVQCDKVFSGNKRLWTHKQDCHNAMAVAKNKN